MQLLLHLNQHLPLPSRIYPIVGEVKLCIEKVCVSEYQFECEFLYLNGLIILT